MHRGAESTEECVKTRVIAVATSGKNAVHIEESWLREGALLETSGVVGVTDAFCLNNRIVVDNWKMHQEWRDRRARQFGGIKSHSLHGHQAIK